MADFKLAPKADRDLKEIYKYSHSNFGIKRADEYVAGLYECLQNLSEMPYNGKEIEIKIIAVTNTEASIFYKIQTNSIKILRLLHNRRDFGRHLN